MVGWFVGLLGVCYFVCVFFCLFVLFRFTCLFSFLLACVFACLLDFLRIIKFVNHTLEYICVFLPTEGDMKLCVNKTEMRCEQ